MSTVEKRHGGGTGRHGNRGGGRVSETFTEASGGGLMDDTDREVSNLTDRAFRSLCIGDEAVYSDAHLGGSSPSTAACITQHQCAFIPEPVTEMPGHALKQEATNEMLAFAVAGGVSEEGGTFQGWLAETQQQQLHTQQLSYLSNGSMDIAWQQRRSTSRVSSLIKAFSGGDPFYDPMNPDTMAMRDSKYREVGAEAWDRSSFLGLQQSELLEYSAFQGGLGPADVDPISGGFTRGGRPKMKGGGPRFLNLNPTNFFLHSQFSPFQAWSLYKRLLFPPPPLQASHAPDTAEFPRWYDSAPYKEFAGPQQAHAAQGGYGAPQWMADEWTQGELSSMQAHAQIQTHTFGSVTQKAWAVEKRCESEMLANGAPWKRSGLAMGRSRLPGQRPSTVSPTAEKRRRPDSAFVSSTTTATTGRTEEPIYGLTAEDPLLGNTATLPSSATPFSISQLLTPSLSTRQETDMTELQQMCLSPSATELEPRAQQVEVRQLRDGYKARASSLLFNLKDNRKRVKSTYSPTRFQKAPPTTAAEDTPRDHMPLSPNPNADGPSRHLLHPQDSSTMSSGTSPQAPASPNTASSLAVPPPPGRETLSPAMPPGSGTDVSGLLPPPSTVSPDIAPLQMSQALPDATKTTSAKIKDSPPGHVTNPPSDVQEPLAREALVPPLGTVPMYAASLSGEHEASMGEKRLQGPETLVPGTHIPRHATVPDPSLYSQTQPNKHPNTYTNAHHKAHSVQHPYTHLDTQSVDGSEDTHSLADTQSLAESLSDTHTRVSTHPSMYDERSLMSSPRPVEHLPVSALTKRKPFTKQQDVPPTYTNPQNGTPAPSITGARKPFIAPSTNPTPILATPTSSISNARKPYSLPASNLISTSAATPTITGGQKSSTIQPTNPTSTTTSATVSTAEALQASTIQDKTPITTTDAGTSSGEPQKVPVVLQGSDQDHQNPDGQMQSAYGWSEQRGGWLLEEGVYSTTTRGPSHQSGVVEIPWTEGHYQRAKGEMDAADITNKDKDRRITKCEDVSPPQTQSQNARFPANTPMHAQAHHRELLSHPIIKQHAHTQDEVQKVYSDKDSIVVIIEDTPSPTETNHFDVTHTQYSRDTYLYSPSHTHSTIAYNPSYTHAQDTHQYSTPYTQHAHNAYPHNAAYTQHIPQTYAYTDAHVQGQTHTHSALQLQNPDVHGYHPPLTEQTPNPQHTRHEMSANPQHLQHTQAGVHNPADVNIPYSLLERESKQLREPAHTQDAHKTIYSPTHTQPNVNKEKQLHIDKHTSKSVQSSNTHMESYTPMNAYDYSPIYTVNADTTKTSNERTGTDMQMFPNKPSQKSINPKGQGNDGAINLVPHQAGKADTVPQKDTEYLRPLQAQTSFKDTESLSYAKSMYDQVLRRETGRISNLETDRLREAVMDLKAASNVITRQEVARRGEEALSKRRTPSSMMSQSEHLEKERTPPRMTHDQSLGDQGAAQQRLKQSIKENGSQPTAIRQPLNTDPANRRGGGGSLAPMSPDIQKATQSQRENKPVANMLTNKEVSANPVPPVASEPRTTDKIPKNSGLLSPKAQLHQSKTNSPTNNNQSTSNQHLSNQSHVPRQPSAALKGAVTNQNTAGISEPTDSKQDTANNIPTFNQQQEKPKVAKKPAINNVHPLKQSPNASNQSYDNSGQIDTPVGQQTPVVAKQLSNNNSDGSYDIPQPLNSQQSPNREQLVDKQKTASKQQFNEKHQPAAVNSTEAIWSEIQNRTHVEVSSPQQTQGLMGAHLPSVGEQTANISRDAPSNTKLSPIYGNPVFPADHNKTNPQSVANQNQQFPSPFTQNEQKHDLKKVNHPSTVNYNQQTPAKHNKQPNLPAKNQNQQLNHPTNQSKVMNPALAKSPNQQLSLPVIGYQQPITDAIPGQNEQTQDPLLTNQLMKPLVTTNQTQEAFSPTLTSHHDTLRNNEELAGSMDREGQSTPQPIKEERFSISDILSIRDKELMRRERLKEIRQRLGEITQPVHHRDPEFERERRDHSQTTEDKGVGVKALERDSSFTDGRERLVVNRAQPLKETETSRNSVSKDRSDLVMANRRDAEKTPGKVLSSRDRAQTKHEILTSKVKAHAQKEISALKERGVLPKHPPKSHYPTTKEKPPEPNPQAKKEITADKLNHLFKDLTKYGEPKESENENLWQVPLSDVQTVQQPLAPETLSSDMMNSAQTSSTKLAVISPENNQNQLEANISKDSSIPTEGKGAKMQKTLNNGFKVENGSDNSKQDVVSQVAPTAENVSLAQPSTLQTETSNLITQTNKKGDIKKTRLDHVKTITSYNNNMTTGQPETVSSSSDLGNMAGILPQTKTESSCETESDKGKEQNTKEKESYRDKEKVGRDAAVSSARTDVSKDKSSSPKEDTNLDLRQRLKDQTMSNSRPFSEPESIQQDKLTSAGQTTIHKAKSVQSFVCDDATETTPNNEPNADEIGAHGTGSLQQVDPETSDIRKDSKEVLSPIKPEPSDISADSSPKETINKICQAELPGNSVKTSVEAGTMSGQIEPPSKHHVQTPSQHKSNSELTKASNASAANKFEQSHKITHRETEETTEKMSDSTIYQSGLSPTQKRESQSSEELKVITKQSDPGDVIRNETKAKSSSNTPEEKPQTGSQEKESTDNKDTAEGDTTDGDTGFFLEIQSIVGYVKPPDNFAGKDSKSSGRPVVTVSFGAGLSVFSVDRQEEENLEQTNEDQQKQEQTAHVGQDAEQQNIEQTRSSQGKNQEQPQNPQTEQKLLKADDTKNKSEKKDDQLEHSVTQQEPQNVDKKEIKPEKIQEQLAHPTNQQRLHEKEQENQCHEQPKLTSAQEKNERKEQWNKNRPENKEVFDKPQALEKRSQGDKEELDKGQAHHQQKECGALKDSDSTISNNFADGANENIKAVEESRDVGSAEKKQKVADKRLHDNYGGQMENKGGRGEAEQIQTAFTMVESAPTKQIDERNGKKPDGTPEKEPEHNSKPVSASKLVADLPDKSLELRHINDSAQEVKAEESRVSSGATSKSNNRDQAKLGGKPDSTAVLKDTTQNINPSSETKINVSAPKDATQKIYINTSLSPTIAQSKSSLAQLLPDSTLIHQQTPGPPLEKALAKEDTNAHLPLVAKVRTTTVPDHVDKDEKRMSADHNRRPRERGQSKERERGGRERGQSNNRGARERGQSNQRGDRGKGQSNERDRMERGQTNETEAGEKGKSNETLKGERGLAKERRGRERGESSDRGAKERTQSNQRDGKDKGLSNENREKEKGQSDEREVRERGESKNRKGEEKGLSDDKGRGERGPSNQKEEREKGLSNQRGGNDRGESNGRSGRDRGESTERRRGEIGLPDEKGRGGRGQSKERGGGERGLSNQKGGRDRGVSTERGEKEKEQFSVKARRERGESSERGQTNERGGQARARGQSMERQQRGREKRQTIEMEKGRNDLTSHGKDKVQETLVAPLSGKAMEKAKQTASGKLLEKWKEQKEAKKMTERQITSPPPSAPNATVQEIDKITQQSISSSVPSHPEKEKQTKYTPVLPTSEKPTPALGSLNPGQNNNLTFPLQSSKDDASLPGVGEAQQKPVDDNKVLTPEKGRTEEPKNRNDQRQVRANSRPDISALADYARLRVLPEQGQDYNAEDPLYPVTHPHLDKNTSDDAYSPSSENFADDRFKREAEAQMARVMRYREREKHTPSRPPDRRPEPSVARRDQTPAFVHGHGENNQTAIASRGSAEDRQSVSTAGRQQDRGRITEAGLRGVEPWKQGSEWNQPQVPITSAVTPPSQVKGRRRGTSLPREAIRDRSTEREFYHQPVTATQRGRPVAPIRNPLSQVEGVGQQRVALVEGAGRPGNESRADRMRMESEIEPLLYYSVNSQEPEQKPRKELGLTPYGYTPQSKLPHRPITDNDAAKAAQNQGAVTQSSLQDPEKKSVKEKAAIKADNGLSQNNPPHHKDDPDTTQNTTHDVGGNPGLTHDALPDSATREERIAHALAVPQSRSNPASPALGKPTMFNVKDNTFKINPVIKAVKPRFHRNAPEGFRPWSPQQGGVERTSTPTEPKPPGGNAPSEDPALMALTNAAFQHLSRAREALTRDTMPRMESPGPREMLSRFRRSLALDDDETRSLVSMLSEDVDGFGTGTSVGDLSEFERPDSVCSMNSERQSGRPPAVPPKTEKALRRAKRLTTRRLKKAEGKTIASVPSSPTQIVSAPLQIPHNPPSPTPTNTSTSASAPSQYNHNSGFTPSATGVVSPTYPVAQRKLLQDPNSGQYFMVDVPLPVKNKTFFDPQTGKYVCLPVRQPPEVALSPPQYMMYPGYLPVPISSLPPARSSSQMSAPATLVQEDNHEASGAPWGVDVEPQHFGMDSVGRGQGRLSYRMQGQSEDDAPLYEGSLGDGSNRQMDIITMSELEDFAMESV